MIKLDIKILSTDEHQFLVELKKGTTKTLNLLRKTCGQVSLRARAFEWHKKFPKGTENLEDV